MQKKFDVVVIGSGPGGYIASIRSAQLGKTVCCVEKWKNKFGILKLGGTCLNVGCIPSKALLYSSELFEKMIHNISEHGISYENIKIDIKKMMNRKNNIVEKMTNGIEFLFKKNKINLLQGHGKIIGKDDIGFKIKINNEEKNEIIYAENVIIATGSKVRQLPMIKIDGKIVVDNEGALSFDSIPKKIIIIGAGIIGLELGSVWRRLGSDVTILDCMKKFLGSLDQSISSEAEKIFKNQGLKINLNILINDIKVENNCVYINYIDINGNKNLIKGDKLIIAIGRTPNTENLGLDNIGINLNENGFIEVDDQCRTSVKNIYAIGDVVRGPMLAHKAEDEGIMVSEIIDGQKPHINYNCIPKVIYTNPEIAWVGKTEEQLINEGREIKLGKFPFVFNGRALSLGESDGFVKIISDMHTDEILGIHIISINASEIISSSVVAMEFKAASEDIARICHPHPTLSESIREAALAVDKRSLNS